MKYKFLLWNLQDFFVFMDKYQNENLEELTEPKWQLLTTSFKSNKPLEKVRAIADLIKKKDLDICFFTEVGGHESLENLNEYFLDEQYEVLHFPSNSDRGIDLGVLAKKSIASSIKTKFHKQKVFARGVHEVLLPINNINLHFLLTHLKSKLNLKGEDFEGRSQREQEVLKLCSIVDNIESKKSNPHPIVLGDLNGIIAKESDEHELSHFASKNGLIDLFEHLNSPIFDRSTYIYYNGHGDAHFMQLDYILMKKESAEAIKINGNVLDFNGETRTNFPKDLKEKRQHPSDHYPIYFEIETI